MDTALLHKATAQAKTQWLEQALADLLPQIWDLTTDQPNWQDTATAWAAQIDHLLKHKQLWTPNQQKNRRTDIANALRIIAPNHPVIPFVLLSSEIYTQLNNEQAHRLNTRTNKFFSAQQADELVQRSITLLDRENPNEIAAGLAVLVGRRISEILISEFQPKTSYSLLFSQAVKRRGKVGMEFEIPTLAPAHRILHAIEQLKDRWNIADLQALNLSDNHLKRRINNRYAGVSPTCRQHFADLIPGREAENDDGERLYTHLFRAVYAEIATYYYKPAWIPDHRFKAEIQGHFKLTDTGEKIPNYSARQNYDDYLIRDRVPGQPGIKLGTPGVEILEVFQADPSVNAPAVSKRKLETGTLNALIYRTVDRLLFSKTWAEAATGLVLLTGRSLPTLLEATLHPQSDFSLIIAGQAVPTLTSAQQILSAWTQWRALDPLPAVQIDPAIQTICQLNFGDLVRLRSLPDLQAIYTAIALHWFCPPTVDETRFLQTIGARDPAGFETIRRDRGVKLRQSPMPELTALLQETAQTHQPPTIAADTEPSPPQPAAPTTMSTSTQLSVDSTLLKTAAATYGIPIRSPETTDGLSDEAALTQVLEHVCQSPPTAAPTAPTPPAPDAGTISAISAISAIQDQAKTLAWLTRRIEALEQQVTTLQQERDAALAQVQQAGNPPQWEQLQAENHRLQQERDEAHHKLQAFRQLLLGSGIDQEATPIAAHSPTLEPASSPEPPESPAASTTRRITTDDALEQIRQAVQAIMALNNQEGRTFNDKWYISFPVVQTLLRAHGFPANQKNVAAVFAELQDELDHHHHQHRIGSRHNRRHPNLGTIADLVNLGP
ncbi:protelomerase family protein [Alkalinema sp. FACHB-956]|uniref:protelomerase family protein n=1 Tax=Alkalinema sp. FACHB-956 TaxID=2692768 RepID=UPI001689DAA5|nr:protelomerase family protein [Alkalinema sp. FACHB-956]MBD2327879.1 hypothetical protein [Alkalinema sp. FACHB-956]